MEMIIYLMLCASIIIADPFDHEIKTNISLAEVIEDAILFIDSEKSSSLVDKIIDEELTQHEGFKFIASFRRENIHFCTASLLSNKHALTTALCLKDFLNDTEIPDFNSYSLLAGKPDAEGGLSCFSIERVHCHSKYNYMAPNHLYDFGLITLIDNNIKESMSISWGMLPQKFMAACGTKVTVTVWEDASKPIEETEWFEFKLKRITFKIVKNDFCDLNHNSPIICARPVNENQTLSKNYLGAPLSKGKLILGVLNFLPPQLGGAVAFTDVYKVDHEIHRFINDNGIHYRTYLPRKKAKYDMKVRNKKESRRVKPKYE